MNTCPKCGSDYSYKSERGCIAFSCHSVRDALGGFIEGEKCVILQRDRLQKRVEELEKASVGLLKAWCDLVNSGDSGFWNPEEDKEVIAMRAALKKGIQ